MPVWIVVGWMGDIEWYEPIAYSTEEEARFAEERLWEHRSSPIAPEWTYGFQKFAVEEVPLTHELNCNTDP